MLSSVGYFINGGQYQLADGFLVDIKSQADSIRADAIRRQIVSMRTHYASRLCTHPSLVPRLPTLRFLIVCIQWNLSLADTIGINNFVHYTKVSLIQGLLQGRHGPALSDSLAQRCCVFRAVSCCTLTGKAKQRLVL